MRYPLLLALFCSLSASALSACTEKTTSGPQSAAAAEPSQVDSTKANTDAQKESVSPAQSYLSFVQAWNEKDRQALSTFSAPSGVLLLDNPGAFRRMQTLPSVESLLDLPGEFDGARIKALSLSEKPEEKPVPEVRCEDDPSVKEGLFLAEAGGDFLLKQLEAELEYELSTKEEVDLKRPVAEAAASAIRFVVADTKHSVKFYFGTVDGAIRLLAVDAVIPCSA